MRLCSITMWRVIVFLIWSCLFVLYVVSLGSISLRHKELDQVVWEAGVNTIRIMLPVLTAFGTFWLGISKTTDAEDTPMSGGQLVAVIALTLIPHFLFSMYLYYFVLSQNYLPQTGEIEFRTAVDRWFTLLSILSPSFILPVGFLLRTGSAPRRLPSPTSRKRNNAKDSP